MKYLFITALAACISTAAFAQEKKEATVKIVINENAGTVDYDTGEVVLNAIQPSAVVSNDYYDTDVLTMNIVSGTEIIQPLRNRILTMDENNVQSVTLEMVAEK